MTKRDLVKAIRKIINQSFLRSSILIVLYPVDYNQRMSVYSLCKDLGLRAFRLDSKFVPSLHKGSDLSYMSPYLKGNAILIYHEGPHEFESFLLLQNLPEVFRNIFVIASTNGVLLTKKRLYILLSEPDVSCKLVLRIMLLCVGILHKTNFLKNILQILVLRRIDLMKMGI